MPLKDERAIMKSISETPRTQLAKIWQHVRHETVHITEDRNILLVVMLAPLVYSLIFSLTYVHGKVYDLPIAVVDYDHSALSRTIIQDLDANESLSVGAVLSDESGLRDLLVREECWGAVVLPRNMERDIKRGQQVQVPMMVNTSNIIIGNYAQKGIQAVLGTVSAGASMEKMMKQGTPGFAVRTSYSPVDTQIWTLFNPASNYALFVLPLLLMLLLHQVIALGAGMSYAKAMSGEAEGFPTATGEMHAAVIGRVVPYAVLAFFWFMASSLGTLMLMGMPVAGSWISLVIFGIFSSLIMALVGSLVGVLVKDKLGVVQVMFFMSMPLLLISGGSWPIESMPGLLRIVALLLPSTHIMMRYRQQVLEGMSAGQMLQTLGLLLLFIVALYAAIATVIKKRSVVA
jgi:ABC-2 type transport system permease protein